MSKIYDVGYEDANIYDWQKVPVVDALEIISGYKTHAEATGNEYLAGLAQGAEDVVMKLVAA